MKKISVIIPCFNEEKTVAVCVAKSLKAISKLGYQGEVLVVDNNSTDDSAKKAREAGARVITEKRQGYGSAYLRGFKEAAGEILVMADADNTYDFLEVPRLVSALEEGSDLVIGSRLKGNIVNGAMPWLHRYIGTPVLSLLLRLFFGGQIVDTQSGFRAIRKEAYDKLNLRTTGMEFASEMIVKSLACGLKIVEVPISYYPRVGESKLRSVRDAWRHIRFMLLYSQRRAQ